MKKREEIMPRLARKYLELSAACYRVATAVHDERGRFRRGHPGRRVHPAVLKKIDLDEALARVYQRFFGNHNDAVEVSFTSTSNSRRQGSETVSSPPNSDRDTPSTSR